MNEKSRRKLWFRLVTRGVIQRCLRWNASFEENDDVMIFNVFGHRNFWVSLEFTSHNDETTGPFITIRIFRNREILIGKIDMDETCDYSIDVNYKLGLAEEEAAFINRIADFLNGYRTDKLGDVNVIVHEEEILERAIAIQNSICEMEQREIEEAHRREKEEERRRKEQLIEEEKRRKKEIRKKQERKRYLAKREKNLWCMIHLYTPRMDYVKSCFLKVALEETGANYDTVIKRINKNKVLAGYIWESEYI